MIFVAAIFLGVRGYFLGNSRLGNSSLGNSSLRNSRLSNSKILCVIAREQSDRSNL